MRNIGIKLVKKRFHVMLMLLCINLMGNVCCLPCYLIGQHPNATHYVQERTDIWNVTQTILDDMNTEGGGTLTFANGTYFLSRNINYGSNVTIKGFGMYETTIQLTDFAPRFAKAGFIRTSRTNNILIANITFDGNKHRQVLDCKDNNLPCNVEYTKSTRYGRYGVFTEGCTNVTFDTVRVINFQGYGFDPHGQKKTNIYGDKLYIKNCISSYNGWDGFTLDQSKDIYVFNCTSRSNGRHGFNVVTGAYNVLIENSTSYVDGYYYPTGTGCGIEIQNNQGFPTKSVTIRNMVIIDPKKGGICTDGVSNITAYMNRIYGKTCFRLFKTKNATYYNNICYNSNPSTRVLMLSTNSNITITNTTNLTDSISNYSGQNLTITVGYSNAATLKAVPGRDAYYVFQQAFDEIAANGIGKMYIEEGIYNISSFLEIGNNITVIGAGMDKTILRLEDNAFPWWKPGTGTKRSGFLRSTHCSNVNFFNLTLDGNRLNQNTDKHSIYGRYGFFTEACNNTIIEGMGIINFQGYGFDPHGVKPSKTWSINLTIINSYSAHNGWDGFTIDQSGYVLLKNNTAYNNGRHGFNIVTGTYMLLAENNIAYGNGYYYYHGNPGCGIAVQNNLKYGTHSIIVRNNTFVYSKVSGICAHDIKNITIYDNTIIKNNSVSCVDTSLLINSTIKNNTCIDINQQPKESPVTKNSTTPRKKPPTIYKKKSNGNAVTYSRLIILVSFIVCLLLLV